MATIRAFSALRPNMALINKLLHKYSTYKIEQMIARLKRGLEPKYPHSRSVNSLDECRIILKELVSTNYYAIHPKAIYIYESQCMIGSQCGIWAEMNLEDVINERLETHERTLTEQQDRIAEYRRTIGIEGTPILLTYRSRSGVDMLIANLKSKISPDIYRKAGTVYRIWPVTDTLDVEGLKRVFNSIDKVFLADGHHRLAAALNMHLAEAQWISALFVADNQIRTSAFHRTFLPEMKIGTEAILQEIGKYYYITLISGNYPYFPDRTHRMGMFLAGSWYQLDLKNDDGLMQQTDVNILQDKILAPVFGVSDPRCDNRLYSTPFREELLERTQSDSNLIAFTLCRIDVDHLIQRIESGTVFPPKSTYIEPKIPYGLILSDVKQLIDHNQDEL
ncbi:DUF1015 family protein [Pedobacter psychrodurus]|uniref:DUF1015 family protein n=1 Tax=Pedobacter psychrodurus TaxID=2530456 RepID=A0A4R0Q6V7_9SPHI|nr:DUF1015 family protein [Pedobacter psychrodurus]TCD28595.1 DUF1015 family protein [Pedobacter psychrodurus]